MNSLVELNIRKYPINGKLFSNINSQNNKTILFSKIISIFILIVGISGGIYRSVMHLESINKFSNSSKSFEISSKKTKFHSKSFNFNEKPFPDIIQ